MDADDVVRIHGFDISAHHGIAIVGSGVVHIDDAALVAIGGRYGIAYAPTGASELYVTNSRLSRFEEATGNGGILIKPSGSGSAKVVLDNVNVEDNATGISIDGRATTGSNAVTVRNSTIAGSTTLGLNAIDSGGGATNVMIEGSSVSNNGSHGVVANGANVTVRMRDSTATGNARGLLPVTSGKIISHGGNVVAGNTVNGAFTSTLPPQ